MKEFLKKNRLVAGLFILFIIASIILFYLYSNGRTTKKDLQALNIGISQEKVIEYIGKPKSKTIDTSEIYNWAPDEIVNNPTKYSPVEMYIYSFESGQARIFFVANQLVYKEPFNLNLSDEEYFDMFLPKK